MLLGRERRSVTEYHYEDEYADESYLRAKHGPRWRTVKAVTTHDPLFLDEDTEGVLERQAERAAQCTGCGQPRDEVWPDGPEDARRMEAEWASQAMKCVACAARDRAKKHHESAENPDTVGIHFPLWRRDG